MPAMKPLPVFFSEEWNRFTEGLIGLDPRAPGGRPIGAERIPLGPDERPTISIPGWNQIVKLGPAPVLVTADWAEHFKAEREGRAPKLPPEVAGRIGQLIAMREAGRTSAAPDWSRSIGQVMTAIDNIQDFASTLATLGRLVLYGAPSALNLIVPGVSAELAEKIGLEAGRRHAAKLAAELGGRAPWNASFIDDAARVVARLVTRQALLGIGARLLLRAVPVVGWVVLASDLLNLMNFIGMIATPLYALLCSGPPAALAAGVPAAVLKNALCREIWTQARLNPFSREARAARHMRSLGRLPSVSNLIEVAQVTDSLFGYGLSLGAIYGAAMEALFASTGPGSLGGASVNTNLLVGSVTGHYTGKIGVMRGGEAAVLEQAAEIARYGPLIAGHTDVFPDDEHLLHMATMLGAVSTVAGFFDGGDHQGLMAELLPKMWHAPTKRPRHMEHVLRGVTDDDAGVGRWWIDGRPRALEGEKLIPLLAKPVTAAVTDFLAPRRNRVEMTFYGAALNQITEHWWYLIGGDAEALRWSLSPDYVILTTLMVEGLLVRQGEHEGRLWKFWMALRAAVDDAGGRMLERPAILAAERAAGITLMRLLPVHAPFPEAWREHFRNPPRDPQVEHGPTPANAW